MRKRKQTKYSWLPVIGQDGIAETEPDTAGFGSISIVNSGTAAAEDLTLTPILLDEPQEGDTAETSLADLIGSEYFIKRIVGKFFCAYTQSDNVGNIVPRIVRVTAGFFIARADTSQANNLPVGTDDPLANYSPQARVNIREPWIWRRTWLLGNKGIGIITGVPNAPTFPTDNTQYGSVSDGPHIDARTARRVRKEERLWFAISCQKVADNITGDDDDNQSGAVSWWLDYRVLGALRKSVARGAF